MAQPTNGQKSLMPIFVAVLSIALGAVVSWNFKIDQRIYDLNGTVITKEDLRDLREDIGQRLSRIETAQQDMIGEIRLIAEARSRPN